MKKQYAVCPKPPKGLPFVIARNEAILLIRTSLRGKIASFLAITLSHYHRKFSILYYFNINRSITHLNSKHYKSTKTTFYNYFILNSILNLLLIIFIYAIFEKG